MLLYGLMLITINNSNTAIFSGNFDVLAILRAVYAINNKKYHEWPCHLYVAVTSTKKHVITKQIFH